MTPEQIYAANEAAAHAALRPRLTTEFLATLVQAAITVGYDVDMIEVISFVQQVYCIADPTAAVPTMEALDYYALPFTPPAA